MNSEDIKTARLQCHLTQSGLGELLNVSQPTVSRWELNRHTPRTRQVKLFVDLIEGKELELSFTDMNFLVGLVRKLI